MELRLSFFAVLASFFLAGITIELVRRKKLKEQYSILWIAASALLIILSIWKSSIEVFANLIGVSYAPSALFIVIIFLGILFMLHISVVVTKLSHENKSLAQKIGIMDLQIKELKDLKTNEDK